MEKKLGLGTGISSCVGMVIGSSMMITLSAGFGAAGHWFLLPMLIAMILNIFVALTFDELHTIMPHINGGIGQYIYVGMGPVPSIVSQLTSNFLTSVFALSVEIVMCGMALHTIFPAVSTIFCAFLVLFMMLLVNLRGIHCFAIVQDISVILLVGTILIMGLIGLLGLGVGEMIPAQTATAAYTGSTSIQLTSYAFWAFVGVETVIPLANHMKNPKRDVLLSMLLAPLLLIIIDSCLGIGMTNYVSLDQLSFSEIPHMLYAEAILGKVGTIWMSGAILLAGITTINTGFENVSAIFNGMAESNLLPKMFSKTNRYHAPYVGLLMVVVCCVLIVISPWGTSLDLLIASASCCWMLCYMMAHISVLVLRKRYPNLERRKRLKLWGIPQVLGIISSMYMIWYISDIPEERVAILAVFAVMLIVTTIFAMLWCKFVMKRKMFAPADIDEVLCSLPNDMEPDEGSIRREAFL